jgi:hypothetical protein
MRRKGVSGSCAQKLLKTMTCDQASFPSSFTACTAQVYCGCASDLGYMRWLVSPRLLQDQGTLLAGHLHMAKRTRRLRPPRWHADACSAATHQNLVAWHGVGNAVAHWASSGRVPQRQQAVRREAGTCHLDCEAAQCTVSNNTAGTVSQAVRSSMNMDCL